jgi:hypothetical protein
MSIILAQSLSDLASALKDAVKLGEADIGRVLATACMQWIRVVSRVHVVH